MDALFSILFAVLGAVVVFVSPLGAVGAVAMALAGGALLAIGLKRRKRGYVAAAVMIVLDLLSVSIFVFGEYLFQKIVAHTGWETVSLKAVVDNVLGTFGAMSMILVFPTWFLAGVLIMAPQRLGLGPFAQGAAIGSAIATAAIFIPMLPDLIAYSSGSRTMPSDYEQGFIGIALIAPGARVAGWVIGGLAGKALAWVLHRASADAPASNA